MCKKSLVKAYPAVFKKEEQGGYFIDFPDVQGAYTEIHDDDVAFGIEMAEEVLGLVLADYIEHGDSLPEASSINQLRNEEDSFVMLVRVDREKYLKETKLM
ncbi:hypothetical protein BAU15_04995 [Enterococcus sp. JM4C]|uniref:type II toxin-antitoxin system HicB family antitoxin n=1 Tax=Candidatus Enterococcus huntleyi TaxID=1857217 RepID=UPI00137B695A|nr:type II toxin-antitoxin system HicB family antitoxin [Enterococcus sp. JM4C]KAF1295114.1 hypothetical protein BAU15_04995 [Enterococcus sp. JM4C]